MIEKLIDFGIAYVTAGSVIGLVIYGIALAIIIKIFGIALAITIKIFKDINKDMED